MTYTEKAERALELAGAFSRDLGHGYVGTEHILLGLIEEGSGVASSILLENGVARQAVLDLIQQQIAPPSSVSIRDRDGYTPKAKQILDASKAEAERFHVK